MHVVGRLAALFLMSTVAGCAAVGSVPSRELPHVWVGSDTTGAIMIQLTRSGDALSGTLDETGLHDTGAPAAKSVHAAFTGTVDRDAMTLSFPQGLGFSTGLSGTLTDEKMSLRFTQDDGTVATLDLRPGSVGGYNDLVAGVNDRASANVSASRAAAEQAAVAAQQDQARAAIDAEATTVGNDVTTLKNALADEPSFDSLDSDISSARDDLAQAKQDAGQAATDDSSAACSDAGAARSDQGAVESDAGSVDSDIAAIGANVDAVNSAISGLDDDLGAYRSAAAGVPDYRSSDAPDETAIRQLVARAHTTTDGWKARGAGYRSTVKKLVAQATDVADRVTGRYC